LQKLKEELPMQEQNSEKTVALAVKTGKMM